MQIEKMIQFTNKIAFLSKSKEVSKVIKNRLSKILNDINYDGITNITLEELVCIIGSNDNFTYQEDHDEYGDFLEKLAIETDENFHHAISHLFSGKDSEGMIYQHINSNPVKITSGELIAIKNQLFLNSQLLELNTKDKNGKISGSDITDFIDKCKIFTYVSGSNLGDLVLAKVLSSLYVIFNAEIVNSQGNYLLDPKFLGADIYLDKTVIRDIIVFLVGEQLKSMSDENLKKIDEDRILDKIDHIIQRFNLYIAQKENGYISEHLRNLYEAQEILHNSHIENDGSNDNNIYSFSGNFDNNIVYKTSTNDKIIPKYIYKPTSSVENYEKLDEILYL